MAKRWFKIALYEQNHSRTNNFGLDHYGPYHDHYLIEWAEDHAGDNYIIERIRWIIEAYKPARVEVLLNGEIFIGLLTPLIAELERRKVGWRFVVRDIKKRKDVKFKIQLIR